MRSLRVWVWSDIACPWCYVGKRRLEEAIAHLPEPGKVQVVWRSFELDPGAPRVQPPGTSYAERLVSKYGASIAEAEAMIARMTAVAAADGLTFRFDRVRPGNTFDAHRLVQLARERGVQGAVKERFLRAYLTDGEPIGEAGALVRLSAEAGLDPKEVRSVLAGHAYAEGVRAGEDEAHWLRLHAVPFFVIGAYGVSGAQPVEALQRALAKAWEGTLEQALPQGAVCGPDGCG
jgi:predicted DsbA family dithiol-disulfide isomerase